MPSTNSIIFSSDAENDLIRIADYLFENGFDPKIADEIRQKATQMLSDHPMMGAIYDEKLGVRRLMVLGMNSIYYSLDDKTTNILHVRAGGMSVNGL
jgi:plasmid stabilization system protein ParE